VRNLHLAERIEDYLTDITLGVFQDEWDEEDCLEFIEKSIAPVLEMLIANLTKEENDHRNSHSA
jgi:hypothetical protein